MHPVTPEAKKESFQYNLELYKQLYKHLSL